MILRTQLRNRNGHLGKLAIDTLDSSMMKKTAADSKAKGKNTELWSAWLIAVWKRMLEFYRLNHSIHQHTSIGFDTSS